MKKLLLPLLLVLAAANSMQAQFVADTTLNTVIQDEQGSAQSTPLTSTTASGKTYVSWFDNSSGQYDLRMQLLDSLGQKLWPGNGILVSHYPQNSALYRYDLCSDHEGNAIVAFQDQRSGSMQIVVYKLSQQGEFLWGNAGVSLTDSTSTGLAPVLTALDNNDVVVAWNAAGTTSGKWVPVKKLNAQTGQTDWSFRMAAEGQKFSRPSLLAGSNGSFYFLFVKETGNFPPVSTMYAQKYSGASMQALWPDQVQVSSKSIPFFYFPQIETDTRNGFFLVFNTGNPANPMLNDAFAQHVDSAGNTWTDEGIQLSMDAGGNKYNGGYCWNWADSSLCVALRMQDGNQTMSGISLQKINLAGERLLGENGLELRAMSTEMYYPGVLLNSGDGLVCLYSIGGFNNQKIRGLKVDYSGQALWTYDPVAAASPGNKDDLSAGPFRNGQTVLVWSEDRSGDDGIYAQNLRIDGHFGNGGTTGVQNLLTEGNFVVYPNPGKETRLRYRGEVKENMTYRIFDFCGRMAESGRLTRDQGNCEVMVGKGLLPGYYFAELETGGRKIRLPFVRE